MKKISSVIANMHCTGVPDSISAASTLFYARIKKLSSSHVDMNFYPVSTSFHFPNLSQVFINCNSIFLNDSL